VLPRCRVLASRRRAAGHHGCAHARAGAWAATRALLLPLLGRGWVFLSSPAARPARARTPQMTLQRARRSSGVHRSRATQVCQAVPGARRAARRSSRTSACARVLREMSPSVRRMKLLHNSA
jgi:hypothetical protein